MRLLALLLFVPPVVLADVGMRTGNSSDFNSVRDIECQKDGGLTCVRDGGTTTGVLRCGAASATDPGCVVPGDQTMPSGKKTWNGRQRIVGGAHGALTACSSGEKGTWQTCTTHNSPVFCDGTSNHELLGAQTTEQVLGTLHVNGLPVSFLGATTLPLTSGWSVTSLSGFWGPGVGSGTLPITIIGNAGTCACSVDCNEPEARTGCDAGTCSFSAGDTLFVLKGTSTCTKDPYVGGNLEIRGVNQ